MFIVEFNTIIIFLFLLIGSTQHYEKVTELL